MNYPSIRIEGAILSPDILEGIEEERGQMPVDFNLDSSAKVKDEIARAWADAQDYWRIFQRKLETLKADSPSTSETRQLWMAPLLGLLGYQLEYQPKGAELNGKIYNISHRATNRAQAPVQIVGYREPAGLDRKPERSNLRMSAHAVVQEFLNLNEQLYGLVTNGRVLRLLRDSSRLIKLSYLEFDLDRIFTDALFADFAILYRLLHATRLPVSNDTTAESLIEGYHQKTIEQGTRIREGLREAVTAALEILGTGFLAHPENHSLREQIEGGGLDHTAFFSNLLRLIYRILFLNVVEERGLIFPKGTSRAKLRAYFDYYSLQRLRRLARTRGLKTERHHDAWLSLLSTFKIFESPEQASRLGTTAFGGQLFDSASLGPLGAARLSNAALLEALDRLCSFDDPKTKQRHPVNFGALATEEFGSVYESLLELHPVVETKPSPRFGFRQVAGNERKTSGSYYTPASLVDCLLDSALDPVIDEYIRNHKELNHLNAEEAILALKVCDPACGSGHFLIAAAQRIARRLSLVRSGDEEPSPDLLRNSLRQVISHCIYAVDINPMSVELCRVALWLEAVEPGKPLSFLDHHIRVGNSLLGATPELISAGLPDKAFNPIEGDEKEICSALKKRNKQEREGQRDMLHLMVAEPESEYNSIAERNRVIDEAPDDTIEEVQKKAEQFRKLVVSPEYRHAQQVADAWCSAFVWEKKLNGPAEPITTDAIRRLEADQKALPLGQLNEVERISDQYQFFHWHLAFPEVFAKGGFNVILGNPPWEKIHLRDEEFFAQRRPEIANARTKAERKKFIDALQEQDPCLLKLYGEEKQKHDRLSAFFRFSGCFPLTGVSRINLYSVFCETALRLVSPNGRFGLVLASGLLTDDNNKLLFESMINRQQLVHAWDFENSQAIFPGVHRSYKFALMCGGGTNLRIRMVDYAFYLQSFEDLKDQQRHFSLSASELELLNPNTKACPTFRSKGDAYLCLQIYLHTPAICSVEPTEYWPGTIKTPFNSANDSASFLDFDQLQNAGAQFGPFHVVTLEAETWLPIYEPKFVHQFNHRFATFSNGANTKAKSALTSLESLMSSSTCVEPRFWLRENLFNERFSGKWFLLIRNVTRSSDARTSIAAIIPERPCVDANLLVDVNAQSALLLCGNMNSYAYDYLARQKIAGIHFNQFIWKQLPLITPKTISIWCTHSLRCEKDWFSARLLELTYTAWDLEPFAQECNWTGPPFRWEEERRFLLRCELDAAFFHLYLSNDKNCDWNSAESKIREDLSRLKGSFPTPRDAVAYIMDTFPIVRRKDEGMYNGDYRTKRVILKIYDAMAVSIRNGQSYQTVLDPPPADPRCCHPARDGTLAPGSCRQLSDLMGDHLPQEPFPFQPPSDLKEALGTMSCQCRVLQPTDPLPEQDAWVIIRHPALLKAGTPCGIAVGRFRYQHQTNAQTGEAFMHVVLRGGQVPAELNIPEAEWKDFRPLAVLHPEQ